MSGLPNARFVSVAGYYTPGDRFRHGIVATGEDRIFEIFFNPQQGEGQSYLGTFPPLAGMGAFYTPDDGFQHIIVARHDGFIEEIFFQPGKVGFASPIARIGGVIGIDAPASRRSGRSIPPRLGSSSWAPSETPSRRAR